MKKLIIIITISALLETSSLASTSVLCADGKVHHRLKGPCVKEQGLSKSTDQKPEKPPFIPQDIIEKTRNLPKITFGKGQSGKGSQRSSRPSQSATPAPNLTSNPASKPNPGQATHSLETLEKHYNDNKALRKILEKIYGSITGNRDKLKDLEGNMPYEGNDFF
ncbi:hypothetical protein, partial [Bartonella rattimassiliensis]|uniref:hypothetical protein n=1 Tax=Bartonella rattimassiliensis TaxID=270250 RepID=UPI00036E15BB